MTRPVAEAATTCATWRSIGRSSSAASRITTIGASEASVPLSVAKSPVTSSWCSALTARRQRPINSGSCAARRIDIERAGGRGCGSALAERHLPGLDDGLEQVVQERFLAGLDMHRGGHPRNDRQRLVPRRRDIAGGAYLHEIVALAFLFVRDGIRTDVLELGRKSTVDGKIVS